MILRTPRSTLFPYTTLFRSVTAQLVVSLIDFAATPAQTVRIPRVHIEATEPIVTAPSISESTSGLLELMGHKVKRGPADRKSTRLNSSHLGISYAVFCLKKI